MLLSRFHSEKMYIRLFYCIRILEVYSWKLSSACSIVQCHGIFAAYL